MTDVAAGMHESGFAIVENAVPIGMIDALVREFESDRPGSAIRRQGAVYGERNLLDGSGVVLDVCQSVAVRRLVEPILGEDCVVVRGLFFDKVPGANWNLSWHQDVTIAVAEQIDVPGFGPWSTKAGVTHVHAPAEVLQDMAAVRIHLDDCPAENGALKVIPGSHRAGKLAARAVAELAARSEPIVCAARRGSALLMSPLVIHASRPSERPLHRRVLHLEFAGGKLPGGLRWRWAVPPRSAGCRITV